MESTSPFNNGVLGAFPDTLGVLDLQRWQHANQVLGILLGFPPTIQTTTSTTNTHVTFSIPRTSAKGKIVRNIRQRHEHRWIPARVPRDPSTAASMDDPRRRVRRNRRLANRHATHPRFNATSPIRCWCDNKQAQRTHSSSHCGDEVTFRQLSSDGSLAVASPITGTQGFANIQVQEVLFASHPWLKQERREGQSFR